jgi:hypothetical protein
MHEECYQCGRPASGDEHAPPESFFPEGYNSGLTTVPSCPDHNTALSKEVEYVRNALSGQHGLNLVATKVFENARASYDRSPKLFNRTFSGMRQIVMDGEETGAYRIELPRFKKVMKAIAYAMYFHDFGVRNKGTLVCFPQPSILAPIFTTACQTATRISAAFWIAAHSSPCQRLSPGFSNMACRVPATAKSIIGLNFTKGSSFMR